jgi:hypothetical protein
MVVFKLRPSVPEADAMTIAPRHEGAKFLRKFQIFVPTNSADN